MFAPAGAIYRHERVVQAFLLVNMHILIAIDRVQWLISSPADCSTECKVGYVLVIRNCRVKFIDHIFAGKLFHCSNSIALCIREYALTKPVKHLAKLITKNTGSCEHKFSKTGTMVRSCYGS